MKRIVIKDLYLPEIESFMDDSEVIEKGIGIVLGGNFWGLYPRLGLDSGVYITTVYDGINTISNTYEGAGSFHDNKFNTIDYARTVNAWVGR
ncbi:MAG: hypothetical protein HCA25_15880 [Dolichospermum sp. DET50]|jgi:hypothetical protein|nr:hypothetical protein [Dolichospermum sp. DET66]MBS3033708.1 hypothetical protein [Dolichospermum sp. DET67]MBS3038911.1 hypothetical protein [Dolichospermum sp. DET50]QSX66167.1 MAG: hypothetical protein EZY12_15145 [Dolichospermum sp. DET69]